MEIDTVIANVMYDITPGNRAYIRRVCCMWNKVICEIGYKCVIEPWMISLEDRKPFYRDMTHLQFGVINFVFRLIAYTPHGYLMYQFNEWYLKLHQETRLNDRDEEFMEHLIKHQYRNTNIFTIDYIFKQYFQSLISKWPDKEVIYEFIPEWKNNSVMKRRINRSEFNLSELRMWLYLYTRLSLIGVMKEAIQYGFANDFAVQIDRE